MKQTLDDAIAAARRSAGRQSPVLGPAARERVLRTAVLDRPAAEPFGALFVPLRRITAAAVAPVVLAGLLAVGLAQRPSGRIADAAQGAVPAIRALKQGDSVQFTIANGGTLHRVTRSTSPVLFDRARSVNVRGEYTDRLDNSASLVFYRID